MKLLTLYGWISYISWQQYIDGDYEYVQTIFNDNCRDIWHPAFKLLNTDQIEIVQGFDGIYRWTIDPITSNELR